MLIKTRGIIFRAFKYRESSLILDVYTEERGLRKYLISGVRSRKARTQAGLLQVMSLVDLVAYERDDRDLTRLKEVRPAYVYHGIPFDVRKGVVGLFMAEVARKAIREREENQPLFRFLYDAFVTLDETPHSVGNFHLFFLLQLSAYLGFQPMGIRSTTTPFFDLQEGIFSTDIPSHRHFLDEQGTAQLYALLTSDWPYLHTVALSVAERRSLLQNLIDYYKLHIEGLGEINAHTVLRDVLG